MGQRNGTQIDSSIKAGLACFVDASYMQESQINEATLDALHLAMVDNRAKSYLDVGQDLAFMSYSLCGDLSIAQ